MQSAVGERLREVGVSIPQCDVLTTLTEKEGVSQQELAKRLYVTKGNISGLIDRLAEAGLVERRPTANDRRQHAIHLTDAGRAMADKAIAVQRRWIAATLGPDGRGRPRGAGGATRQAEGHRARGADPRDGAGGEGMIIDRARPSACT